MPALIALHPVAGHRISSSAATSGAPTALIQAASHSKNPLHRTSLSNFLPTTTFPFPLSFPKNKIAVAASKPSSAFSNLFPVFHSKNTNNNAVPSVRLSPENERCLVSQLLMLLTTGALLCCIIILLILTFHLWRRNTMLESTLRRRRKFSLPPYSDEEDCTPPPPPYVKDERRSREVAVDGSKSKSIDDAEASRRPAARVYEVPNYDFLDCDCYDGDGWASLPSEECRCSRKAETRR